MIAEYLLIFIHRGLWGILSSMPCQTHQNQRCGIGTHNPKLPKSRVNNLTLHFMLQCLDCFQYLSKLRYLCSVNIQSQLPSFVLINKHRLFPFSHQFSKTGKCFRLRSCIYTGESLHAHSSTIWVSAPESCFNPAFQPCRELCRAMQEKVLHAR